MKKLIAMLLVLAMVLSFAACAKQDTATPTVADVAITTAAADPRLKPKQPVIPPTCLVTRPCTLLVSSGVPSTPGTSSEPTRITPWPSPLVPATVLPCSRPCTCGT